VSVFPAQLHIGDGFTDDESEWEVISLHMTFKQGHEVRARVQRPGEPASAREAYWPADERVAIRPQPKESHGGSERSGRIISGG